MPSPLRRNEHGLLVYAPSASRAEMSALAFEQIIDAAASSTQVQASVAEALAAVERASPGADFGGALDSLRARIRHVGRSASWYPDDRVRIERLLATAGSGLQARAGAGRGS